MDKVVENKAMARAERSECIIKEKARVFSDTGFRKKAMTYSPTRCSTICAGGLNFSVRDGKR